MHQNPDHTDAPAPDPDATGFDARPHFAPPVTVTRYVVYHHEQPVSGEYEHWTEAELFRLFDTPATDGYTIRPVRATTSPRADDRRDNDRHSPRIL